MAQPGKSGPALAAGCALTIISTWSLEAGQGALAIVHWNLYVPKVVIPVIVVVGELAVVMLAITGPLTCVHVPVPDVGVLPAIVAEPGVEQIV
jgi:hypothetical protein